MTEYKVTITRTVTYTGYVEADDYDAALDAAHTMDISKMEVDDYETDDVEVEEED